MRFAVRGSQARLPRAFTNLKPSQMRSPSSARLEPRMPGSTNTAGRLAAAGDGVRGDEALGAEVVTFTARVPLASVPAHDSGPMAWKSFGSVSVKALAIAAAVRALEK